MVIFNPKIIRDVEENKLGNSYQLFLLKYEIWSRNSYFGNKTFNEVENFSQLLNKSQIEINEVDRSFSEHIHLVSGQNL